MNDDHRPQGRPPTLPGILGGIAAVITALAGLIAVLAHDTPIFQHSAQSASAPAVSASVPAVVSATSPVVSASAPTAASATTPKPTPEPDTIVNVPLDRLFPEPSKVSDLVSQILPRGSIHSLPNEALSRGNYIDLKYVDPKIALQFLNEAQNEHKWQYYQICNADKLLSIQFSWDRLNSTKNAIKYLGMMKSTWQATTRLDEVEDVMDVGDRSFANYTGDAGAVDVARSCNARGEPEDYILYNLTFQRRNVIGSVLVFGKRENDKIIWPLRIALGQLMLRTLQEAEEIK
ncbi:hypothetical protein OKW49_005965 [Paraburkholderia youngii]|uniref:hypothetical protein n=1 Tax=Paraburkholderia youngii TaxID=2782701 RepID=UPI003D252B4E